MTETEKLEFDILKREVARLRQENSDLAREVVRLREYEWMYKDLCK